MNNAKTTSSVACELMSQASDLVLGARLEDYGDFFANVCRISELSSVPVLNVCDVLVALKQTRLEHTPNHTDSSIDLVAYTALREGVRIRLATGKSGHV